jgi:hypothetical protein
MAVTTQPQKYTKELLAACERTLRNHNLRCKPGITLANVLDTLTANQCTVEESFGQLAITMSGTPAHTQKVMEGLARERQELFYPRDVTAVKSRDEMDQQGKIEYLKTHKLEEWERLPQTATASTVVVLDPSRMTSSEWLSLDRKTRSDLAGQWTQAELGSVLARKK